MLRKLLFINFFLLLNYGVWCQNLVPNPYFDNGDTTYDYSKLKGWDDMNQNFSINSPIFCTKKNPNCFPGLWSLLPPLKKEGYVFLTNQDDSLNRHNNARTFIRTWLKDTLKTGENYVVEFHYFTPEVAELYINYFGAKFDQVQRPYLNEQFKRYTPDIEWHHPFRENKHWVKMKGSYIAQGNEYWLTLGNFRVDPNNPIRPNPNYIDPNFSDPRMSYANSICIDGVFVYKASDTVYTTGLPKEMVICQGDSTLLSAVPQGFMLEDTSTTYLWSTGQTDSVIWVTQPGNYSVTVDINHRFKITENTEVFVLPENLQVILTDTITKCLDEPTALSVPIFEKANYLWQDGSTSHEFFTTDTGQVWVEVWTDCAYTSDTTHIIANNCSGEIELPNAFTPNQDGLNDFFDIKGIPGVYELTVYNRWGNMVYHNKTCENNWGGQNKAGEVLAPSTYTYKVIYYSNGKPRYIRGRVTIVY